MKCPGDHRTFHPFLSELPRTPVRAIQVVAAIDPRNRGLRRAHSAGAVAGEAILEHLTNDRTG
jgi:hypothetical protein